MKGLLDSSILYLSKYILSTKEDYDRLLKDIHNKGNWEDWIRYILKGIQETSEKSLNILRQINEFMENTSNEIREKHPKMYSKELVDILFVEFYTRINNVEVGLNVTRKTASNYLKELVESGILEVEVRGKDKLFINKRLLKIMKGM